MLRRAPLLVIAVAALLLVEPLIHSHPLWENSDARNAVHTGVCVVCSATNAQLPIAAPVVTAPAVVVGTLTATPPSATPAVAAPAPASRAPPAA